MTESAITIIAVLLFVAWLIWFTTSPPRSHSCDCDDEEEDEMWTEDEL